MIDLIVLSSSRPKYLKNGYDTLKDHLKYTGEIKWLLHEDIHNEVASMELLKWAYDKFDTIVIEDPQGEYMVVRSMGTMLKVVTAEYMFTWYDDFYALRDIDLNSAVKVMDKNPNVNQIAFNKRPTVLQKHGEPMRREVQLSGVNLTLGYRWTSMPGLWRVSHIKQYWQDIDKPVMWGKESGGIKERGGTVGTYFMGKIEEPAFVDHVGYGQSSIRLKTEKFK